MMKSIVISAVLLLCCFCAAAQNEEIISIGKKETIYSKVLNENRKIWIYTPNLTSQNTAPDKQYPVLYLLDGNAHFYSTVGIIQQLSQANGNGVLPEMIVVGIENTNRLRDLVPPSDMTKTNPFIDFLSSELIQYVNKNYKASPYKLLVGHSLGGLTVIDVLSKSPNLFNAYIAIDPSMWYNNEKTLNQTLAQLPKQKMNGKRLFVSAANTLPKGIAITQVKKDKSPETQHIRSIFKLDDYLKINTNGLSYAQKYYEGDSHNSVPLISTYDGLRFIFDYYHLDARERDFADSTAMIALKLKSHYAKVSEKMGYKNSAPEDLINYLAYDALGKRHFNKSKRLFELNMEWYPQSINVYDSYAEYFLAKADTINAIANYKKALLIKNDSTTIKKVNALTSKQVKGILSKDLQKYTGIYTFEAFKLDISLELREGSLWAVIPGQPADEFEPISENVFKIKGKQGYTISFEMAGDKPKGFTSIQPNGAFKAVFKK